MSGIGFSGSAGARLALGIAFCVGAVALAWSVERERDPAAPAVVAVAPTAGRTIRPLTVEATFAVAGWSISRLGVELPASESGPTSWRGEVAVGPDDELLIVARAAPAEAGANHCLRIRLGDRPPQLAWGVGDLTATATP